MINRELFDKYVERSGLTEKQVAESVGMTEKAYHKKLDRGLGSDETEALAEALHIPVWMRSEVFFGGTDADEAEADEKRRAIAELLEQTNNVPILDFLLDFTREFMKRWYLAR